MQIKRSHFLQWLNSKNVEATEKNQTSCLTQKNTAHVNLDNVSGLLVLLHTIACIIELGHGGAELVKIITKCVRAQIIHYLCKDFRKTSNTFTKFKLFLVSQVNSSIERCFFQLSISDTRETNY